MQRPIGVTLLAIGAAWPASSRSGGCSYSPESQIGPSSARKFSFSGNPQWGQVFWAGLLALIWFWVAAGFWNVRAYAWSFGNFISLFTFIWGFFALLFGSSIEAETIPWFLAFLIFMYLNYPGVRNQFYESEMSRLTPEQRLAMEQLQSANAAAQVAMATPAAPAPAPVAPAPAAPPPAAPAPAAPPPPPPVDEPPASS